MLRVSFASRMAARAGSAARFSARLRFLRPGAPVRRFAPSCLARSFGVAQLMSLPFKHLTGSHQPAKRQSNQPSDNRPTPDQAQSEHRLDADWRQRELALPTEKEGVKCVLTETGPDYREYTCS